MAVPKKKEHKLHGADLKKQRAKEVKPGLLKYLLPLSGILLISFIAYTPVLKNGFVNWDDDRYILNNPALLSINLKNIFSQFAEGNYHPFTMLAYAIQYQFFGISPGGYHAVSLLFHLLNTVLVFYVILFLSNKFEVAVVASLLFGIHPMHVESVAWASELKDLLYAFFFLASFIFYLKYLKEDKRKFYFYSLALFLCSLFSKAMAASLPVVLVLTDYIVQKKWNSRMLVNKIPYFILSVIFGVIAIIAQSSSDAMGKISEFTPLQNIIFAGYGFITYLVKLILPIHLSAYYPYPINAGESIPVLYYGYFILFVILIAFVFYSLRVSKKIFFGVGFFAITVFLVLQLLPVGRVIMADRYSYIPSIGIFYLAGEGFYWLWSKRGTMVYLKQAAIFTLLGFTIFFSVNTYSRCGIWKDSLTLWSNVINEYKIIPIAYNNRGLILAKENRPDEALKDYDQAIALQPGVAEVYNNRGALLMNIKKYEAALKDFNKCIELKPDYGEAYNNRGILFQTLNKFEEALLDYNKTIELVPNYAGGYVNRGNLLQLEKRKDEAMKDYNRALELNPNLPEPYYNRAIIKFSLGMNEQACLDIERAARLGLQLAIDAYPQYCQQKN